MRTEDLRPSRGGGRVELSPESTVGWSSCIGRERPQTAPIPFTLTSPRKTLLENRSFSEVFLANPGPREEGHPRWPRAHGL